MTRLLTGPDRPAPALVTAIEEWVRRAGRTVTTTDLGAAFGDIKRGTLASALFRMTARGTLVRPAHGRYALGQRSDRLTGPDRQALVARLAADYAAGASIRTLAETHGRSYGYVHKMLTREAGVTLRPRGADSRSASAPRRVCRCGARAELADVREQVELLTLVCRLRLAGHDMPNTDHGPEPRPRHAQGSSV